MVIGFGAAIRTADDTEKPRVEIRIDPATLTLTGTVKADNLSSDEGLDVYVDGRLNDSNRLTPLSHVFVGPNGDGEATAKLEVPVPAGRFDDVAVTGHTGSGGLRCADPADRKVREDGGTGCATLQLPPRDARPQLAATWDGKPALGDAVKLTLAAPNAPAGSRLLLRVSGRRHGRTVQLYRAALKPPSTGILRREVRLPVPENVRLVCAEAFVLGNEAAPRVSCPPARARGIAATVEMRR
jgi:hypothetical protein